VVSFVAVRERPERKATLKEKTGWLEKHQGGRVVSMVEVKYHRVKVKKTPRKKKGGAAGGSFRNADLYYVIDKKVSYGEMYLTGESVFNKNEIVELLLFAVKLKARLRILAKVKRTETFYELKRPMFRGDLQFAAVNKEDFENLKRLENQRLQEEAQRPAFKAPPPPKNSIRMTFKKT
jgi:hypothetical protein